MFRTHEVMRQTRIPSSICWIIKFDRNKEKGANNQQGKDGRKKKKKKENRLNWHYNNIEYKCWVEGNYLRHKVQWLQVKFKLKSIWKSFNDHLHVNPLVKMENSLPFIERIEIWIGLRGRKSATYPVYRLMTFLKQIFIAFLPTFYELLV